MHEQPPNLNPNGHLFSGSRRFFSGRQYCLSTCRALWKSLFLLHPLLPTQTTQTNHSNIEPSNHQTSLTTQATMASNTASQVFNITELAEAILLHADDHQLQTTLPESRSKSAMSSPDQRSYSAAFTTPNTHSGTTRPSLQPPSRPPCSAGQPLATKMAGFPHEDPPQVPSNCSWYQRHVHFEAKGLDWACDTTSTDSQSFRSMLVCQPPIIAIETLCFSQVDYRPCPKIDRIENVSGITCGELFDHVKAQAPVAGQASLSLFFRPADAVVSSTS